MNPDEVTFKKGFQFLLKPFFLARIFPSCPVCVSFIPEYKYLGDRLTVSPNKGRLCTAVRLANGKCVRGRNGAMLVRWETGETCVLIGRLLRRIRPVTGGHS